MSEVGTTLRLRDYERVIRADHVEQWLAGRANDSCLSLMVLTTERIVFEPPNVSKWQAAAWLLARRWIRLRAQVNILAFDLAEITRFWTWQPRFSGAPMLQTKMRSCSFQLLDNTDGHWVSASRDSVEAHYLVVESAWEAVRFRATTHDPQP